MTRALEIVEALLDINEDLNSKMPVLLKQFPELTQEQITQYAQADPTSPQRADYITWLLRLLKRQQWDGNPEPVRGLLTRFEEIKRAHFGGYEGKKDINQFATIDELAQTLEANKMAGTRKERQIKGVKPISKVGDLQTLQMLTSDAAVKFAIGKGTPEKPQTRWCTSARDTAQGYLNQGNNLFVTMKGSDPYVQVHFASSQAKNIQDAEINPSVAKEIAPCYSGPEFEPLWGKFQYRPTGWAVNDSHIEKQLSRLIKRWYNEQLEGHTHARTGDWVGPSTTKVAEARESLRGKLKAFFDLFATSVAKQDEQIIRQIGERHGNPNGIQALFNSVYELEHPKEVALPPLLQDYAAFEQRFDDLAARYESENYRGRT